MAQLGYGTRRECQEAEKLLAAKGFDGVGAVIKVLSKRKTLDAGLVHEFTAAYGKHDQVKRLLAELAEKRTKQAN